MGRSEVADPARVLKWLVLALAMESWKYSHAALAFDETSDTGKPAVCTRSRFEEAMMSFSDLHSQTVMCTKNKLQEASRFVANVRPQLTTCTRNRFKEESKCRLHEGTSEETENCNTFLSATLGNSSQIEDAQDEETDPGIESCLKVKVDEAKEFIADVVPGLVLHLRSTVVETSSSVLGFCMWLGFLALTSAATPLKPLMKDLVSLLVGLYFATAIPLLYQIAVFLLLLQRLSRWTVQWTRPLHRQFWRTGGWIRHTPCHPSLTQQLFFLAWLPLTLSLTTILWFVAGIWLVLFLHLAFLLHVQTTEQERSDCLQLAVHIHAMLAKSKRPLLLSLGAVLVFRNLALLPGLMVAFLLLIPAGGLLMLWCDEDLRSAYKRKLWNVRQVLPKWEQVVMFFFLHDLGTLVLPYLRFYQDLASHWQGELQVPQQSCLIFGAGGFMTAFALTLCEWLHHSGPVDILWPRLFLICAGFASYTAKTNHVWGRSQAYLCGISLCLGIEMVITGCVCGCKVSSALGILWVAGQILTHAVLVWATIPPALVLMNFYSWSFPLRKFLFKCWLDERQQRDGIIKFRVPGTTDKVLDEALEQT
eukprot:Skav225540  [mRNA]  locus=scaffold339:54482:56251:- [translate_table: standard]